MCFQRFLHSFPQNISCVAKNEYLGYVLLVIG